MKLSELEWEASPFRTAQTQMAMAFQALRKPMYEGTVPAGVKAARRAKGKLAKAARKAQRR